ncbi:LysR family transcriptional regulator [Aurantimonas aggregata]|uniref:LysR family transcriptional regulator n=1 Tax=Aurantimonas aggregata TaxID=2047720 RepID=A0A6L9MIF9_9HYPH|nr:LysR family transcriptional regulator [Aurantimonas aggregata]NDV87653.1 LysR family transcriptional regulator [Aurantimonas aggregata]
MSETGEGAVSLRLLSIFAAMMGGATTQEAAERLKMSQPAVSNGIRQLETALGVTLFERLHRRLQPTEEAFLLFEEIRPIFPILRGFEARARAMRSGLSGRLRVLSTPPLGHSVGAQALGALLEARPEVNVSYDVRRLEHVLEAVQNGAVDLGLGLGLESHPALNVEVVARVDMVCLLPAASPLAGQDHIRAGDLFGDGLIGLEAESRLGQAVRLAFERDGAHYAPRVEVRYCSTAAVLAATVPAATIVDPFSAALRAPTLVERPFAPACSVPVALFFRRGVPRSRLVQAFVTYVRAALKDFTAEAAAMPAEPTMNGPAG